MDNLRRIINILFCDANSEDILNSIFKTNTSTNYSNKITDQWLINVLDNKNTGYTKDELKFITNVTNDSWLVFPEDNIYKNEKSVFYTLLHLVKVILDEEDEEPLVKFEYLLKWRDISYLIGEDIFTTSYFAYKDIKANKSRNYFSWKNIINSNNKVLRNIIERGLSELHFHLWGSAYVFDLNWISLMNDVTNRAGDFDKIKTRKMPETIYGFTGNIPIQLYERCIKAAALRLFIYSILYGFTNKKTNKILTNIIHAASSEIGRAHV